MFDCAISSCAGLVREHNLVLGSDAGEEAGEARSKQQRKKATSKHNGTCLRSSAIAILKHKCEIRWLQRRQGAYGTKITVFAELLILCEACLSTELVIGDRWLRSWHPVVEQRSRHSRQSPPRGKGPFLDNFCKILGRGKFRTVNTHFLRRHRKEHEIWG